MDYTATAVGDAVGIAQGELQGSLRNLETISRIVTPVIWGRIYGLGAERGMPSLFYYVAAAAGLVQVGLLMLLARAAPPAPRE